ncbi:MAG TPA: hypothetical protein VG106_16205 [Vicinamibacterales bacterium]|nr:hypothetical protein [Vicinamibacterales bacterium]
MGPESRMLFVERRRVQRVKLIEHLRGTIDAQRVFVIDVSLRGIRVAHQESLGRVGDTVTLSASWDGRPLRLQCELVRTQIHRAETATTKTLYHSGLTIRQALGTSAMTLRELIETHIKRAIDEQKANAQGIPAANAQSVQTGKPSHYMRHELIGGRWRETATSDPTQPQNGFTVSAEHSPHEVAMLRSAFERGDARTGGRDMIRRLAKLSISSAEAVSTRRFMP